MILSGQADMESTIAAVNEGHIFRFLTKPCSGEHLIDAVDSALRQYELVNAEKELLEKTLSGAVRILTEILGMTNPGAYSRAARIQRYAEGLIERAWPATLLGTAAGNDAVADRLRGAAA